MQTSKLLASRASNYRLKSITSPSNHKSPFGWRDFRKDGKNGRKKWRENYFCGCLVREMREWNIGGVRLLSPQAHQKPISPIWRENGREKRGFIAKDNFAPFSHWKFLLLLLLLLSFFFHLCQPKSTWANYQHFFLFTNVLHNSFGIFFLIFILTNLIKDRKSVV